MTLLDIFLWFILLVSYVFSFNAINKYFVLEDEKHTEKFLSSIRWESFDAILNLLVSNEASYSY